jgi:hypothetical protein
MALKTKNVALDFGLGVDEYTDPKMVKPGKLLRAENVAFNSAKKIEKRNGYKPVSMIEAETGMRIDRPLEIHTLKNNPIVFSKNKLYTSTKSKLLSDILEWRDSKQFNFPVEVDSNIVSEWNSYSSRDYVETEESIPVSDLSLHSSTIETNDTVVKCSAFCSSSQGGVSVVVRDVNTNEVLVERSDLLDNIIGASGIQTTWVNPKIIPWRSVGLSPDKFIIIVSAKMSIRYIGENPITGTVAPIPDVESATDTPAYRVILVTLDSLVGPDIKEVGSLWEWLGIADPVLNDFPYVNNDDPNYDPGVGPPTTYKPTLRRAYSQFTDLLYDEDDSVAWFVFGGTGITRYDFADHLTEDLRDNWDITWQQRVYVLKIEQGGTTSGFTGGVFAATPEPSTASSYPYSGTLPVIISDSHYAAPPQNATVPGVDEPPYSTPQSYVWEVSCGLPNVPLSGGPSQRPRWGSSGYNPMTYDEKRVCPSNFDEIFRVSATFNTNSFSSSKHYDRINVVCSTICRNDENLPPIYFGPPDVHWEYPDDGATEQRTFLCSFDLLGSAGDRLNTGRVDLTRGATRKDLTDSPAIGDVPRTPNAFICTNAQIVTPYVNPGTSTFDTLGAYVVLYFEEQINNSYILQQISHGGGRRFFTIVVSAIGWTDFEEDLGILESVHYSDVLTFTKPAARAGLMDYKTDNPDAPENDRNYLFLPTVRKNISLMATPSYSADIYNLIYDGTPPDKSLAEIPAVNLSEPHTIAKAMDGTAFGSPSEPISISGTYNPEKKIDFDFPVYSAALNIGIKTVETTLESSTKALEFGNNLYTSGGFLRCWNGQNYCENNFHFKPMITDINNSGLENPFQPINFKKARWSRMIQRAAAAAAGDGSLSEDDLLQQRLDNSLADELLFIDPTGASTNPTYQFCFVYEWVDGNGEIHKSMTSERIHIQGADVDEAPPDQIGENSGGDEYPPCSIRFKVTMIPPAFTEKEKIESINIKAYRTLNLIAGEGIEPPGTADEFYEDTNASIQASYEATNMWSLNNATSDWVSGNIIFSTKDSEIAKNQLLYTSYGTLGYITAPPTKAMAEHDGRLFCISSEDPYTVYYSNPRKLLSSTTFNVAAQIKTKQVGGPLVGLATNGGRLFMFKERSIFAVYGEPVNAAGAGGGYSSPQQVSEDVGCTNPLSILETSEGIFFQSGEDIYLIDNGFNLVKIGVSVSLDSSERIHSIVRKTKDSEIRFCHEDGMLIYNTWFKQWIRSTMKSAGNSVMVGDDHYLIEGGNNTVVKENENYYGNMSTPIKTDIETAWIKINTPQGMERLRNVLFLGELEEDTTFDLEVFYNYNEYPSETISVTASDIASLEAWGSATASDPTGDDPDHVWGGWNFWGGNNVDHVFQFRHKPKIQKCESIKFRIREKNLESSTKGYALNTILLEIASKKGGMKLKAAKTI